MLWCHDNVLGRFRECEGWNAAISTNVTDFDVHNVKRLDHPFKHWQRRDYVQNIYPFVELISDL